MRLLLRPSPFADADAFEPGQETVRFLRNEVRVLVVGAGGLGCEILKNLALSGFRHIDVVDMDRTDVSNLNRQFLFRGEDVGKPKAQAAAQRINDVMGHLGVKVTPHFCRIQDVPPSLFDECNIIISGLDNIEARRWLNAYLHAMLQGDLSEEKKKEAIRILIDGGTEGLKGQSRMIVPSMTSCFECSLDAFPPQVSYPLCTIAETPRLPEHCIEYALLILWPRTFPAKSPDFDKSEDLRWLYEAAKHRADLFGIEGVTLRSTLGVVKRIVPAVASSNAVIAASLVNEAFKAMTYSGPLLDTYFMYMGHHGIYTHTFSYERKEGCLVCGVNELKMELAQSDTVQVLMERLNTPRYGSLDRPSITSGAGVLYMRGNAFAPQHEKQLQCSMQELIERGVFQSGESLVLTHPASPVPIRLHLDVL